MINISNKLDGESTLSAEEFNSLKNEIGDLITNSGQELSLSDTAQLRKAVSITSRSLYTEDTSTTVNVLTLSRPNALVDTGAYYDGMVVMFSTANRNTGASTVTVGGLPLKKVLNPIGEELQDGIILANKNYFLVYDQASNNGNGAFKLFGIQNKKLTEFIEMNKIPVTNLVDMDSNTIETTSFGVVGVNVLNLPNNPQFLETLCWCDTNITQTCYTLEGGGIWKRFKADETGWHPWVKLVSNNELVGQVAYFARNSTPKGWLKANGATISRTTYANLFNAIGTLWGAGDGSTTFTIPDLRAEFLRGWDDGRGVDANRLFGTNQDSNNLAHTHNFEQQGGNSSSFVAFSNLFGNDGSGYAGGSNYDDRFITMLNSGINESRPRNVALLACIKY